MQRQGGRDVYGNRDSRVLATGGPDRLAIATQRVHAGRNRILDSVHYFQLSSYGREYLMDIVVQDGVRGGAACGTGQPGVGGGERGAAPGVGECGVRGGAACGTGQPGV